MAKVRTKGQPKKTKSSSPLWVFGIVIVAAAILGFWLLNRGDGANTQLPDQISVSEAFAKREAGAFILDVRQPEEWQEYHVPESTLIPLGELKNRVNELPGDREIVVVCRSGNRSRAGRDTLLQAGFTQVTSMAGGLNEWRSAGYPTISGD